MDQLNAIFLRLFAAFLLIVMSALIYEALKQATLGQAIFSAHHARYRLFWLWGFRLCL